MKLQIDNKQIVFVNEQTEGGKEVKENQLQNVSELELTWKVQEAYCREAKEF